MIDVKHIRNKLVTHTGGAHANIDKFTYGEYGVASRYLSAMTKRTFQSLIERPES